MRPSGETYSFAMQTQYDSWNIVELYASTYLVVNRQEYTKHIYAGSKRIVSKLGVGLESSIVDPLEYTVEYDGEYGELGTALQEYLDNNLSCAEIGPENVSRIFDLEVISENHVTPASEVESDIYFYHTDHLGSSSWITYTDGSVTQHLQSLPFGEPFIDQRATSYDICYIPIAIGITGKEMDSETGYQYFGARYYNSDISVWLSVDPLSDKYPSMSSYMYTAGNPVMLVDPDGRDWFLNDKTGDVYYNSEMKKGDEGTGAMEGKGWVHMGENGMFKKSEDDVMNNDLAVLNRIGYGLAEGKENGGIIKHENGDGSFSLEATFKGDNAKKFMNKMGYEFLATKKYVEEYTDVTITPEYPASNSWDKTVKETNYRYLKKDERHFWVNTDSYKESYFKVTGKNTRRTINYEVYEIKNHRGLNIFHKLMLKLGVSILKELAF